MKCETCGTECVICDECLAKEQVGTVVMAESDLERLFALNSQQRDGRIHPYTCGNKSSHRPLIACHDGWRCADCDYRQPFRNEVILTRGPQVG